MIRMAAGLVRIFGICYFFVAIPANYGDRIANFNSIGTRHIN